MAPGILRKTVLRLTPLLVILLFLEGLAWLLDGHLNFRHKLVSALRMMEVRNQPATPPADLKWPGNSIMVRAPAPPKPKLYYVGGKLIRGADASVGSTLIYPGGVRADARKVVFIVGGSAAYGYPYPYESTMTAKLNDRLSGAGYVFYNVSQVGFDSAPLVPIAKRIVDHYEPYALVIFTGNNEWVRWQPTAQAGLSATRLRLLRHLAGSRALAGLEYLLLRRFVRSSNAGTGDFVPQQELFGSRHALEHPLDPSVFDPALWPRIKARYLANFRRNLETMIGDAKEKGVRVFVCTMPIQYKLSPSWKHPQPTHYTEGRKIDLQALVNTLNALPEGEGYPIALKHLDMALEKDERIPLLHYLRGYVLERMNQLDEAETAYEACREHMIGNLGSMHSVNRVIQETAEVGDAELVDLKKIFDDYEHERGRRFNQDLVHDDCHPTPLGHQIISDEIARRLERGSMKE